MSTFDAGRDTTPELTLECLGVDTMTADQLAHLAEHLRTLAGFTDELRFLNLEAAHNWRERIPNRPTIGYYLRSRRKTA